MDNYEILKESKIIYEYINNLMTNGNFEINNEKMTKLNQATDIVKEIYENTHEIMNKDDVERESLKIDLPCPCCHKDIFISDLIDYAYVCDRCDENYYSFEKNLDHEWYFEPRNKGKLENDIYLELSYNTKKEKVIIGNESSSGAEYECRNMSDLIKAFEGYINYYLTYTNTETYSIKIWETEELREQGESFIHLETYQSKEDAILDAKKIINRHNYAYIAVIKNSDNSTVFETDVNEEFYYDRNYNKIYKVSSEELKNYVDNWINKTLPKNSYNLLYCNEDNIFIAVDNTSDDCWVEEFETETQAVFWLISSVSTEEVPFSIIPKDITKRVIDTTINKNMEIEMKS